MPSSKRPHLFRMISQMSPRRRRLVGKSVLGYVIGWIIAGCSVVFLIASDSVYRPLWLVALLGIPTGLIASYFEMRFAPSFSRRISMAEMLLFRTIFYALLVTLMVLIYVALSIVVGPSEKKFLEVLGSAEFQDRIKGPRFWLSIVLYTLTSAMINFARQVRRIMGHGKTTKLFFGRFEKPKEENRLFMFLDLQSSVKISEDLGPVKFNRFKNDFFHDIVEPILETEGEIYQYVGDEVVITWEYGQGTKEANFARCFWDIFDIILVEKEKYMRRYNTYPIFRAGVAGGRVVTAAIGDLKKDIVYSGDPVNLAARLEGKAKDLNLPLLADRDVLTKYLGDSREFSIIDQGQFDMKGFNDQIKVVSVSRKA